MPTKEDPLLLTVDQTAALLQIGRDQVYNLCHRADFPALRIGLLTCHTDCGIILLGRGWPYMYKKPPITSVTYCPQKFTQAVRVKIGGF